ncbi:MAG: DUF2235 domain-containing protein [Acetobacteraceae bacterium]
MAKTIIFCADGTWNGPGSLTGDDTAGPTTNVFKLFVNLEGRSTTETALLANEQESSLVDADGTVVQVAKYIHGVGDSGNFLVKALGGTMGAGLITRIVRGYTFISRNYLPGDSIVIVGFSRGAYTARALGGLIAAQGLLDARHHDLTEGRLPPRRLGLVRVPRERAAGEAQPAGTAADAAARPAALRLRTARRCRPGGRADHGGGGVGHRGLSRHPGVHPQGGPRRCLPVRRHGAEPQGRARPARRRGG